MTLDDSPIVEIVLTVQFAPAVMPLNPIELAEIYGLFRADYPAFEQIGRAGPMPINPAITELVLMTGTPRNSFRSPNQRSALIFQEDRFSYTWFREARNEESSYPGFKTILARALKDWGLLRNTLFTHTLTPQALIGEVVYTNHFETGAVQNSEQISSIYNFLNPDFNTSMSSYAFGWYEPHLGSGFLQMQISGPVPGHDGSMLSRLQTTARFLIEGDWEGLGTCFDNSHVAIYDAFKRLINPAFRSH